MLENIMFFEKILCKKTKNKPKKKQTIRNLFFGADNLAKHRFNDMIMQEVVLLLSNFSIYICLYAISRGIQSGWEFRGKNNY